MHTSHYSRLKKPTIIYRLLPREDYHVYIRRGTYQYAYAPSPRTLRPDLFSFFFRTLLLSSFWTSRGHRNRPFSPPVLAFFFFIAHRVQQSHRSSIIHRVLLTHALAFSASQFVHKKKSPRIYTSMHSGGFELTKLTYTRLEDNLIRHRDDRRRCKGVRVHGLKTTAMRSNE